MTHGIDTDFLVALEIADHVFHTPADHLLDQILVDGHSLALAPQTLAEFLHVVTDPRRMAQPLAMKEAIARTEFWWQAREVVRVFPDAPATQRFFEWLRTHNLGRKRLLDTLLAATFAAHEIHTIITNNELDYQVFGTFRIIRYGNPQ